MKEAIGGCSPSDEIEAWAKTQKRITNKMLREHLDVDEETADMYYRHLKMSGIVESMGYVIGKERKG